MNRNWIHMQDGTQDGTDYDLVVTTTDTVAVGTMVTIEGTVALDQDFGFGYTYELLVQDALVH
jgi:hypothetical protein